MPNTIKILQKLASNFPFRFMTTASFFSIVLLNNFSNLQATENQILLSAFHFFSIPSYVDTNLYIGDPYSPIMFSPPLHIQILFTIFFVSLAISTASKFRIRLKILSYVIWSITCFLVSEILITVLLYWTNIKLYEAYLYGVYVASSLVGSFLIERCLFKNITWPKGGKIKPIVKRTYIDEYLYLVAMLVTSSILMYVIVILLQVDSNSLTFSYLVLNIAIIFSFNNFLAYFLIEAKIPSWAKKPKSQINSNYIPVSFLLPAYNEEKTIKRCIESIDRAASNYLGNTEIVVVNDGSTDHTRKIASDAVLNLKNCSGKVFNIPNSGKGFALRYGLKRTSGNVIFRIDTDSIIDEKAIRPIVEHFRDPMIGSVSGVILPLEEKSIWQKIIFLDFLFVYLFYKKEEELVDSIMVQSGAFSVFRKDALLKVGGWTDNRFGEDGEITIRLGRYGYKNELEPRSILRTDQPADWKSLREQRVRWNIGYYYSRSSNFGLIKEFRGPRTIMYLFSIYAHGVDFVYAISLPFFILGLSIEYYNYHVPSSTIFADLYRIIIIDLILFGLQHVFHLYCACKFKRYDLIAYVPFMRLYSIINQIIFRTEATEILLTWSSQWKVYSKESFNALRQVMKATLLT